MIELKTVRYLAPNAFDRTNISIVVWPLTYLNLYLKSYVKVKIVELKARTINGMTSVSHNPRSWKILYSALR